MTTKVTKKKRAPKTTAVSANKSNKVVRQPILDDNDVRPAPMPSSPVQGPVDTSMPLAEKIALGVSLTALLLALILLLA